MEKAMSGVNNTHKAEALGSQGIYRSVANRISWVVIGISVFVFLSWVFDIEAGKRVLPALASMKFNTALCFIACGVILRRKVGAKAPGNDPVAAFLIIFILLVSGCKHRSKSAAICRISTQSDFSSDRKSIKHCAIQAGHSRDWK